MNEKTAELMAQLAQKMGTTAEHLWGVLVSAQRALGMADLMVGILLLGIVVVCGKAVRWSVNGERDSYDEMPVVVTIFASIGGVSCLIGAVRFLYVAAIELTSPEYAALRFLLQQVSLR